MEKKTLDFFPWFGILLVEQIAGNWWFGILGYSWDDLGEVKFLGICKGKMIWESSWINSWILGQDPGNFREETPVVFTNTNCLLVLIMNINPLGHTVIHRFWSIHRLFFIRSSMVTGFLLLCFRIPVLVVVSSDIILSLLNHRITKPLWQRVNLGM